RCHCAAAAPGGHDANFRGLSRWQRPFPTLTRGQKGCFMIRFARLLAASAIGTGIGIGLILCLSLTPLLRPTPSTVSTGGATPVSLVTTDWCAQQHTNDPTAQAYIGLQCAVHSALFDDGEQPGAAYRFDDFVAAPGFYEGVNYADQ